MKTFLTLCIAICFISGPIVSEAKSADSIVDLFDNDEEDTGFESIKPVVGLLGALAKGSKRPGIEKLSDRDLYESAEMIHTFLGIVKGIKARFIPILKSLIRVAEKFISALENSLNDASGDDLEDFNIASLKMFAKKTK